MEWVMVALLSTILFFLPDNLELKLIYGGALVGVIILAGARSFAGRVEDPNISLLTSTLQISVRLMQLAIVGAIASLSYIILSTTGDFTAIALFGSISFASYLLLILFDQIILRKSMDSINSMADELAGDDYIGRLMGGIIDTQTDMAEDAINSGENPDKTNQIKHFLILLGLFPVFILITSPASWLLSQATGSWKLALVFPLSLVFVRDTTRYLYYTYGAANSVNHFKLRVRWELLWLVLLGLILAATLGYNISAPL